MDSREGQGFERAVMEKINPSGKMKLTAGDQRFRMILCADT